MTRSTGTGNMVQRIPSTVLSMYQSSNYQTVRTNMNIRTCFTTSEDLDAGLRRVDTILTVVAYVVTRTRSFCRTNHAPRMIKCMIDWSIGYQDNVRRRLMDDRRWMVQCNVVFEKLFSRWCVFVQLSELECCG